MAIVVIGGQTRNIGKTSIAAGLIAALGGAEWTAFKITQFGHGVCSANGEPCACEIDCCTRAVSEERDAASGTDTARFLAAGAVRSLWVRTRQGQLADAMPRIAKELAAAKNAIVESNSILRFLDPDLYLAVLDPGNPDFKSSAQSYFPRADAVLWTKAASPGGAGPVRIAQTCWPVHLARQASQRPQFWLEPTFRATPALIRFVADRLRPPTAP